MASFSDSLPSMYGFEVMMSDREKTAIDCIDRPALAGGVAGAASILAAASRRLEWPRAVEYLPEASRSSRSRISPGITAMASVVNLAREDLVESAGLGQRKAARS